MDQGRAFGVNLVGLVDLKKQRSKRGSTRVLKKVLTSSFVLPEKAFSMSSLLTSPPGSLSDTSSRLQPSMAK